MSANTIVPFPGRKAFSATAVACARETAAVDAPAPALPARPQLGASTTAKPNAMPTARRRQGPRVARRCTMAQACRVDAAVDSGRMAYSAPESSRAVQATRGGSRVRALEPLETFTSRYSVSRCTGVLPVARMRWTSSSVDVRCVVPAAETTFSSSITEPMSSAPKPSATWPIFMPWVTQLDWMCGTLSR